MIRLALFIFLALVSVARADPPPQPLPWTQVTEFYVNTGPARMYSDNAVWGGTHIGPGYNYGLTQENVWHTVDMTVFGVAVDAKAAFLSGVLIITAGTTYETADLHVVFRKPGDTTPCDKYIGQTVIAGFGGQRSGFASWAPLVNGKTEFCFQTFTVGDYPLHAAYGFNLSLQAWVK